MKKIDFHVHVFPDAIAKKVVDILASGAHYVPHTDGTLAMTKHFLDANGTDAFVALNIAQTPRQQKNANGFMCAIKEDNIFPFAALHPFADDYEYELDKALDYGLKGVKLHPEYQAFDMDDKAVYPFYKKCIDKGMILLFHGGYDPAYEHSRRGYPDRAAKVLDEFLGARIVLAHMGNPLSLDEAERFLLKKDVFFDISMAYFTIDSKKCGEFIKSHGSEKFLYATDTPWSLPKDTENFVKAMGLSLKEEENIFHKNAGRLLGII